MKDWHAESGEYRILIGKSSRDIVLEGAVEVVSTTAVPVVYTANSLIGDLMEQAATRDIAKELMAATGLLAASEDEPDDMMLALMKYMPLRGTVAFSQGKFTDAMLSELLERLNGGARAQGRAE